MFAAECAEKKWSVVRRRREDTQEALEVLEKWIEELRNVQNGGVRESVERQAKRTLNKVCRTCAKSSRNFPKH